MNEDLGVSVPSVPTAPLVNGAVPSPPSGQVSTDAAHTPGPWHYRNREYDDWGIVRASQDSRGFAPVICQARDPYCLDETDLAVHRANKTDPWEANARLVAAAPELLDALAEVFADHGKVNSLAWTDKAAAALTKAGA